MRACVGGFCHVSLHCITWIITARSPGPRLSLNGQSQLKLGYWRPRAEQPGHQESKIKQRPLLPPKNRPSLAGRNQVNAERKLPKDFQRACILHVSSWPPQAQSSPLRLKGELLPWSSTSWTKQRRPTLRSGFDPWGQNQWRYYNCEQQDYIKSERFKENRLFHFISNLNNTVSGHQ